MLFISSYLKRKLRKLDVSSEYAFWVGISSIIISFIVTVITFYKLLLQGTHFLTALFVCITIFYVFTEIYSFIALVGLKFFEKVEDKL